MRSKLGIPVELKKATRDIQEVKIKMAGDGSTANSELIIRRRDDRTAVIHRADQAERVMPLAPRDLGDLLAEDVRRLDADEVYSEALSAWTGVRDLSKRNPKREHIWHDPVTTPGADVVDGTMGPDPKEPAKASAKPRKQAASPEPATKK